MKRFVSIILAITIIFSFSTVSFAYTHPDYNLTSYVKISERNTTPAAKSFFTEFFNAPKNRRIILGSYDDVYGMMYTFCLFDRPVSTLNCLPLSNSEAEVCLFPPIYVNVKYLITRTPPYFPTFPNDDTFISLRAEFPVSANYGPMNTVKFGFSFIVMDSTTININTSGAPNLTWNWKKTTPFEVIFGDDEDPPSSSSSEPPKPPDPPPSFPDFPPIVIPPIDPPDLVPPYDDEYIWYDPSVWEDFFKHISKDIGSAVNIGIILIGLLFGIYLIIRVIRHYVRGDDLFKG